MTDTAEIYEQVNTVVNTKPTKTWTLVDTISNCAVYEGASANAFVSEKFKAKTDAVVIINPNDLTIDSINDDYRIIINSVKYLVVHADNIMNLNSVLAVAVMIDKTK